MSGVRVANVVPAKIAKKAVQRNQLRRKMYEVIRPIFKQITPGQHIVVFAKSAALLVTFEQLSKEMRDSFVKAGLLM